MSGQKAKKCPKDATTQQIPQKESARTEFIFLTQKTKKIGDIGTLIDVKMIKRKKNKVNACLKKVIAKDKENTTVTLKSRITRRKVISLRHLFFPNSTFQCSNTIPTSRIREKSQCITYQLFSLHNFANATQKNPNVIEVLRQVPETIGSFQTVLKRASGEVMMISQVTSSYHFTFQSFLPAWCSTCVLRSLVERIMRSGISRITVTVTVRLLLSLVSKAIYLSFSVSESLSLSGSHCHWY